MSPSTLDIERGLTRLYDVLTRESASPEALAVLADVTAAVGDHACEDYCEDEHVEDGDHCCEIECTLEHVEDDNHCCDDYCERDHVDDFGNPEDIVDIASLAASKWIRKHGELPVEGEDLWVRDMREVMIALGRATEDPTGSSRDLGHALRYGSLDLR